MYYIGVYTTKITKYVNLLRNGENKYYISYYSFSLEKWK